MQKKSERQIQGLNEDYFAQAESGNRTVGYSRAGMEYSIAWNYLRNINEANRRSKRAVESLIEESAKAHKGGAA